MVAGFCRDRGLFLISDEVYREFVYDGAHGEERAHLAGDDEHVIVVDSLSKRYSACGIRLGCLVTPQPERARRPRMKMAQGRLSAPGLAQVVGGGRARARPRVHAGRRRRVPEAARHPLRGPVRRSPASSCASRRARSTSWPACP